MRRCSSSASPRRGRRVAAAETSFDLVVIDVGFDVFVLGLGHVVIDLEYSGNPDPEPTVHPVPVYGPAPSPTHTTSGTPFPSVWSRQPWSQSTPARTYAEINRSSRKERKGAGEVKLNSCGGYCFDGIGHWQRGIRPTHRGLRESGLARPGARGSGHGIQRGIVLSARTHRRDASSRARAETHPSFKYLARLETDAANAEVGRADPRRPILRTILLAFGSGGKAATGPTKSGASTTRGSIRTTTTSSNRRS